MRTWRGSVRFALSVMAASVVAAPASAQLLIATPLGESDAVASAELAFASGGGAPVTWIALRLHGAPVALVAALPDGAKSGPALDAWMSALELTASPNVLLPNNGSDCGKTSSYVHVAWPRSAGESPEELSVQQPEDVTAALASSGVSLWGDLPKASRYLVWTWPKSEGDRTTKTLRVVGGEAPLSFVAGPQFPLVVSAITQDPVSYPGELPNSGLDITFVAGKPSSNYIEQLQSFLRPASPPVLEMRGRAPLFDWSIFDNVSLAPLVRSYATRAKRELPKLDDDACSEQLRALRDPEAPAAAACGAADDAGLALAAVASNKVTLQRFIASAHAGLSPAEATSGGAWQSPVVNADRLDGSGCPQVESPPVVIEPAQPVETGTTGSDPNGSTTVAVEETVVVDDGTGYQDSGCGCGTTTPDPTYESSSDRSSCSSDTSSTSDGSSDSCSGDTSSSSSSDSSSGCSGDSSSSSNSDSSSGCSGDSSSSSNSGSSDSCSGDSSSSSSSSSGDSGCSSGSTEGSSYSGDTCTASARPGAEPAGQSHASLSTPSGLRGARRVKTSLWGVAMLALVLPIRRRKRGGRRVS